MRDFSVSAGTYMIQFGHSSHEALVPYPIPPGEDAISKDIKVASLFIPKTSESNIMIFIERFKFSFLDRQGRVFCTDSQSGCR